MKKRIFSIMALFVIAMSSSCFAAHWEWICSNEKFGLFFDADSIEVQQITVKPPTGKFSVWEKIIYDESFAAKHIYVKGVPVREEKLYVTYYSDDKGYVIHERYLYDKEGNILQEMRNLKARYSNVPDTVADVYCNALMEYIVKHNVPVKRL